MNFQFLRSISPIAYDAKDPSITGHVYMRLSVPAINQNDFTVQVSNQYYLIENGRMIHLRSGRLRVLPWPEYSALVGALIPDDEQSLAPEMVIRAFLRGALYTINQTKPFGTTDKDWEIVSIDDKHPDLSAHQEQSPEQYYT